MKIPKILAPLFFLVLLAYGFTLQMYFLIDDNALIYKLQHVNEAVGFWGQGAIGAGPYRHIVDQFVIFYPFFKTNPIPYYAVGLILYFLSSVAVYYFTRALSGNKKIAAITSLIFAAGYVGSETMYGIVNSWQTARGLIMALLTFYFYLKFLRSNPFRFKAIYYLLSAILFFGSLDTVYIRAHGLIFSLIFFDIIFAPLKLSVKSVFSTLARLTPFILIHYFVYLRGSAGFIRGFLIFNLFNEAFLQKRYELLTIPIQDLGNLFIPDKITSYLNVLLVKFAAFPRELSVGSLIAGIIYIVLSLWLLKKYWKKDNQLMRVFLFSIIWTVANFIIFYLKETGHTLWTTHRYFSYSFYGICLFWAVVAQKLTKTKKIFAYLPFLLILVFLWLGISKEAAFNKSRSIPAKDMFAKFQVAVPKLKKGDVLYFNISNDSLIAGQFGSFFGGMFSEASNFAIYTPGIDYANDILFTYSFDDVLKLLQEKQLKIENLHAFYYGPDGLVDITNKIKDSLVLQKTYAIENVKVGNSIELTPDSSIPSYIPGTFLISMKVDLKPQNVNDFKEANNQISEAEKEKVFAYLQSRNNYYKSVKVTSASFWKDQTVSLAVDGRLDTSWRGNRGYWGEYDAGRQPPEFFQADLGHIEPVGGIRWYTAQKPLVPSEYKIFTSIDGRNWKLVKEVKKYQNVAEGTEIFDTFDKTDARFVKMEILKDREDDGPEIKEFEVVTAEFVDLPGSEIADVENNPFSRIMNSKEYEEAANFVRNNATIKIFWKSDADPRWLETNYKEMPLFVDGRVHTYQIPLTAAGLAWQGFSVTGFNFPANIEVEKAELRPQTLK